MKLKISENRKTILLVSIILLALAIVIAIYTQILRGNAKATWWDQTWLYRKGVNISNSNTVDLTNYQISFFLDTASIIAEGEMQVDCDDLRIVDSNNTLLSHWIEEDSNGCNSSYTKIWVKVPTISQGVDTTTLYAYYGNPGATNVEDGDSVFRFFDDFNDTVIDSTKWPTQSLGGYISESGGELIVGQVLAGDYYIQSPAYSSAELPMVIEARTRTLTIPTNGWSPVMWWQSTTEGASILEHGGGDQYTRNDGSWSQRTSGNPLSEYHKNSLILSSTTGWTGESTFESTTSASWSVTHSNTFSGDYFIKIGPRHDEQALGSQNTDGRVDYIYAREYASVEPTISFIPEDTTSITPPIGYWKLDDDFTESSYTIPTDGLVTYWTLDQETGTGAYLLDESGNGNHATPTGATFVDGLSNGARSFDGINDYIRVDGTLASITPVTITGWVNPLSTSGYVVNQFQDVGISWGVKIVSGEIHVFNDTSGVSNIHYFSTPITPGEWIHFAAGHKEDGFFLYLNGQLIGEGGSDGVGPTSVSGNLFMGQRGNNSTYLNGIIDEVRIYNRALDSTEVSGLYGKYKPLVADSSGNNYHGAPVGTTVVEDLCISGKCRRFDGINDYISIGTLGDLGSSLTTNSTTFQFWIKTTDTDAISQFGTINDDIKTLYVVQFNRDENDAYSAGKLGLNIRGEAGGNLRGAADVPDLYDGEWHFVSVIGNVLAKSIEIYIDGAKQTTVYGAQDTISTTANFQHPFILGASNSRGTIQNYLECELDQIKIYDYSRTEEEMKSDYIAGASIVGSRAVLGNNEGTTSTPAIDQNLVGYWRFEEGLGTTVTDLSGENNTGTINGATWVDEGYFGKALSFDGSNDYIGVSSPTGIPIGNSIYTIAAWIKPSATGSRGIVGWGNYGSTNQVNALRIEGSNEIRNYWWANDIDAPVGTIQTGNWYHVVATFDGTTRSVYWNGTLADSDTPSGHNVPSASNFRIGSTNNGEYFSGLIDEVRIYDSSLTGEEVSELYEISSPYVFGTTLGQLATSEYCVPGDTSTCNLPLAEWLFNGKQGTTVSDTSGNSNNGTLNGASWTKGMSSSGVKFDGVDDYIDLSSTLSNIEGLNTGTISGWFKSSNSSGQHILNISDKDTVDDYVYIGLNNLTSTYSDESLFFAVTRGGATQVSGYVRRGDGFFTDGEWHHFAITSDSTGNKIYIDGRKQSVTYTNGSSATQELTDINSADTFRLGNRLLSGYDDSYFNGSMDQIRVYDYALNPAQIAWDYNGGEPIAYWKLDECQGTTAYDSSVNNHNGTITIGASGTQSSPGFCTSDNPIDAWYNGNIGKFNSSLSFDGVDDHIEIANSDDLDGGSDAVLTVAAWFKANDTSVTQALVSKCQSTSNKDWSMGLTPNTCGGAATCTGSPPYFRYFSEVSGGDYGLWYGPIENDKWYHGVFVLDQPNNNLYLYINGKLVASDESLPSVSAKTTVPIQIGDDYAYDMPFNGQIDEVRIYNYALTAEQIQLLYNNNSVVRF